MGTNAVQGEGGKAGFTHDTTIMRAGRGMGKTAAAPQTVLALTLRLALWDERPWTDLPARLAKIPALRLMPEETPEDTLDDKDERADGLLIIRRWPTPIVLHRLAEIVKAANAPVLLCTAAPSEACAEVLRLGVADILRDDMHHAEVLARVALRCSAGRETEGAQLAFGPLLLDRMQRMAWVNGRMVRLTPLQFDLLTVLMQGALTTAGKVTAQALWRAVWGLNFDPGTNRIAVHIHHLRRALQDVGGGVGVEAEGGGYALIL